MNQYLEIILSAGGGAVLMKVADWLFLGKKEKKDFDQKVRDELWDRIKNLEGRLDEQNRMLMVVMQENAAYKFENAMLKEGKNDN